MDQNDTFTHSDKDWENRRLCSDGNCIGVIGADGKCNACGQEYVGTPPAAADDYPEEPVMEKTLTENTFDASMPDDTGDEWEHRRLCSDENCIGVIGPDGTCKECGKPYI